MTDFIYPKIIFASSFGDHDRLEYTLCLNNIAYEYFTKRSANMFQQPYVVDIIENGIPNWGEHGAIAVCDKPDHFESYMPHDSDWIVLRAYATLLAHEMAHMVLLQHYGDMKTSNNLVHYALNLEQHGNPKYLYKIYRKFLDMPIMQLDIEVLDIQALIKDHDYIMANCYQTTGSNPYQ